MTEESIRIGTADGEPFTMPIEAVLTGRGAILGKSGAGKSNSMSVVIEQLLEAGYACLIVDVEGEYYGLKEQYEVLHAGADAECDIQVGPEHAGKLAELALEQHVPIVLDVSGYVDEGGPGEQSNTARELIRETAQRLFTREKDLKYPFLLIVEEIHEFVPEGGGLDAVGQQLVQIAKRGRKRGLGLVGLSQRPADVKKDLLTQANWLVWHRLTWENDVRVVKDVVGRGPADEIDSLADGEAFVQFDWSDAGVQRIQFDRKQTFDAGATPGLEDVDRPELKSVSNELLDELSEISAQADQRRDRIAQLEATIEEKDETIDELEAEIERLRTADETLDLLTQRLQGSGGDGEVSSEFQERLEEKNERIRELEDRIRTEEERVEELEADLSDKEQELERLETYRERVEEAEEIEERLDTARAVLDGDFSMEGGNDELRDRLQELRQENRRLTRKLESGNGTEPASDLAGMIAHESVQKAVQIATEKADIADRHFDRVLAVLANAEDGGPLTAPEIAPMTDVGESAVRKASNALHKAGIVDKVSKGNATAYGLDREFLETRIEVAQSDPSSGGGTA